MKALSTLLGIVAWFVAVAITRGYVLAKLWLWFVVAQFKVAELSIAGAIGIAIIVGLFTHMPKKDDEKKVKKSDAVIAMIVALLSPAVSLLLGWIVKQFMLSP